MNKIFNWTFGSVFRTFGRIFAYLLVGVLLGLFMQKNGLKLTDLLGIDRIYASEIINNDYEKFSIRNYSTQSAEYSWTSFNNTGIPITNNQSTEYVSGIRTRFGYTSKFQKGTTYRVKVNVILNNGNKYKYFKPDDYKCLGSIDNSNTMNEDLIDTCNFVSMVLYENDTRAHFYFDVKPNTNIYSLQVQWYYNYNHTINLPTTIFTPLEVGTGSNVSYDNSEMEAINNQTNTIINNNNQNTQEIINNQTELLSSKCTNLLDPTLKTSLNHRGITFAPNINNGTVNYYEVYGTRTSASNAYAVIGYLDIKKGTNVKVYTSDPSVYIQFWNTTNNTGIPNGLGIHNNTYTFTQDYNNVEIAVWTDKSTIDYATIYVMITESDDTTYCMYGTNISKLDNVSNSISDLKDSITDSSGPSLSGLSNDTTAGWLPAGPLDSVLNLPLTLINSLINGMSGSCAPLRVPLPYVNLDLPIPCMSSIYTQMGFGTFFNWVGNIAAAFILFTYLLNLYKYVDDTLTFRENNFIDNWSGV